MLDFSVTWCFKYVRSFNFTLKFLLLKLCLVNLNKFLTVFLFMLEFSGYLVIYLFICKRFVFSFSLSQDSHLFMIHDFIFVCLFAFYSFCFSHLWIQTRFSFTHDLIPILFYLLFAFLSFFFLQFLSLNTNLNKICIESFLTFPFILFYFQNFWHVAKTWIIIIFLF